MLRGLVPPLRTRSRARRARRARHLRLLPACLYRYGGAVRADSTGGVAPARLLLLHLLPALKRRLFYLSAYLVLLTGRRRVHACILLDNVARVVMRAPYTAPYLNCHFMRLPSPAAFLRVTAAPRYSLLRAACHYLPWLFAAEWKRRWRGGGRKAGGTGGRLSNWAAGGGNRYWRVSADTWPGTAAWKRDHSPPASFASPVAASRLVKPGERRVFHEGCRMSGKRRRGGSAAGCGKRRRAAAAHSCKPVFSASFTATAHYSAAARSPWPELCCRARAAEGTRGDTWKTSPRVATWRGGSNAATVDAGRGFIAVVAVVIFARGMALRKRAPCVAPPLHAASACLPASNVSRAVVTGDAHFFAWNGDETGISVCCHRA